LPATLLGVADDVAARDLLSARQGGGKRRVFIVLAFRGPGMLLPLMPLAEPFRTILRVLIILLVAIVALYAIVVLYVIVVLLGFVGIHVPVPGFR
jgi:hypothetical protein